MHNFTETLEKIKEERLEKLKHANSVRMSYPTKTAPPVEPPVAPVEPSTDAVPHHSTVEDIILF
jgi:hypothetical protein